MAITPAVGKPWDDGEALDLPRPIHYCPAELRTAASLLIASIVTLTGTPAASLAQEATRSEPTRVERAISEDPLIDQHLVASLPAPSGDLHIAAVEPGMLALTTRFRSIWPTRGEITTYFGEVDRYSPRGHSGLDIAAPEGTPVVAADVGEVLKAYWNGDGYGGLIIIAHPSGYETWYGHLDRFDVAQGEQVTRGEQIGLMGSTGFSTGSHLHFEVRQDGQLRDPLEFLDAGALKAAADDGPP